MDPKAVEHVKEILHDKKRVWGQMMQEACTMSGLEAEQIATLISGLCSIYLMFGEHARVFANCILIGVPLFVYVFAPQEKPKHELMMIYCTCYAVSTILDLSLQSGIPAYYLVKVIAHALLFLRPYVLSEKLLVAYEQIKSGDSNKEDLESHKLFSKEELKKLFDRKAKSPPPEKPEGEKPRKNTTSVTSPWPQSTEMRTIEARSPPEHVRTAVSPSVAHQISDKPGVFQPKCGPTIMESAPSPYQLDSSSSASSVDSDASTPRGGRGVGAYDIEFQPKNKIIFNGPFDYAHVTYHIRMKNTARFPVAYAIKSNAIPRVTASPASGIIKPSKSIYIAVTVQKMDNFDDSQTTKDRIAFEMVRVSEETTQFDFKLLQLSTIKVRKNIYIKYNP